MPQQTKPINCAVTMIIFNRYDNAKQVFDEIRKVKPPKLFVIADGPRIDRPHEAELCTKTRNIIEEVDWKCEIITHFSDTNMGCQQRIATGLTWLFTQVEESIILEDDCLPSLSFFYYCEELLEKYRHDKRIMMISGNNHSFSKPKTAGVIENDSYYFTRHVHIWGWATWARAWESYDLSMKKWPAYKKSGYLSAFFNKKSYYYFWEAMFDFYLKKRIPSWDGAWVFAVWSQSGLSIAPKVNLIQNTGVSADATHTTNHDCYSRLNRQELDFPLQHPECIVENRLLDNREMKIRLREMKRLPYPLCKWASKIKWFIKEL